LQRLGLQNTQIIVGDFKDTLPKVLAQLPKLDYVFFDGNHSMEATLDYFNQCKKLANNDTIFVFDDINWNDDMQECWQIIKIDKDVKITLDIFFMGIVFFRGENTEKEDFTIRY
jgi:predicted O-methyltransferase YrrM